MIKQILGISIIGVAVLPISAQAQGEVPLHVTTGWSNYFRSIRSIQFDSTVIAKYPVGAPISGFTANGKFRANGNKYFTSLMYVSGGLSGNAATSYNGTEYRSVVTGKNLPVLQKSTSQPQIDYMPIEPFTAIYSFVFSKSDTKTLTTLQSPQVWALFRKRTGDWRTSTRDGKAGYLFNVYSDANKTLALDRLEVFVENESKLVTGWKRYKNKNDELSGEMTVAKSVFVTGSGVRINFPVSVVGKAYQAKDGKIFEASTAISVATASIRLNLPVNAPIFTISESQGLFDIGR